MAHPDKHRLLAELSRHQGADNGVSVQALATAIGALPRHVRTLVSQLRADGVAICGHPTTGYYIALTAEELEATCQFLRARAMHSLVLESQLRRMPLADLVGQLHLAT